MEAKKNPKANLEKSRGIFFLTGLMIAMALTLWAFNVSSTTGEVPILSNFNGESIEDPVVIQTEQQDKQITPPPPTKEVADILNITDDPDVEDLTDIFDAEANEDTRIELSIQKITTKPVEEDDDEPLLIAPVMPQFPGGEIGLRKYLSEHVNYPQKAVQDGIEGKVYVRFCVNAKGLVERVSIARSIDPLLDNEAIRVVKALPKWKPGENGGRKVSVWYTVPINFQLK